MGCKASGPDHHEDSKSCVLLCMVGIKSALRTTCGGHPASPCLAYNLAMVIIWSPLKVVAKIFTFSKSKWTKAESV
jgi:hypothetical protein